MKMLLAHGADSKLIPEDMWRDYMAIPKPDGDAGWWSRSDTDRKMIAKGRVS